MLTVRIYKENSIYYENKFDVIKQFLSEKNDLILIFGIKKGSIKIPEFESCEYEIEILSKDTNDVILDKSKYYFKEFEITIPQEFSQNAISLVFTKPSKHI